MTEQAESKDGWVTFAISAPTGPLVLHDWQTVWGVHCLRKSMFVDGKQVSEVYLPGPWIA